MRRRAPIKPRSLAASEAEGLVACILERQGWTCLARNFRDIGCELDIVATKGRTIAVVEVKARWRWCGASADAATLLSPRKQEALKHGARRFLAARAPDLAYDTVRFDLALVINGTRGDAPKVLYHTNVLGD